jgi:hypothetical protein
MSPLLCAPPMLLADALNQTMPPISSVDQDFWSKQYEDFVHLEAAKIFQVQVGN